MLGLTLMFDAHCVGIAQMEQPISKYNIVGGQHLEKIKPEVVFRLLRRGTYCSMSAKGNLNPRQRINASEEGVGSLRAKRRTSVERYSTKDSREADYSLRWSCSRFIEWLIVPLDFQSYIKMAHHYEHVVWTLWLIPGPGLIYGSVE